MTSEPETITEKAKISDLIPKLDVDAVGIASVAEWKGTKLEETTRKLLPEARSVVVFAMGIYPEILTLVSPGKTMGVASLNDFLDRHADFLNGRLTKAAYDLAKASHNMGVKALPLPAVGCPLDTRFLEAVFSYKHAGQAAGLGKIGWHSLLITPAFGSKVRLAACLTEVTLEPIHTNMTIECNGCGICITNCPAEALKEPQTNEQYAINKFACSTFRSASGSCCECMRVCPAGK